jgi:membrane protease subunit HflK
MAWNEPGKPGGDKDQDPWNKNRGEQGPPDLEDIVKNLQNKVTGIFGGRRGGGGAGQGRGGDGGMSGIILIIFILLGVWVAYSSIYVLNPRENGVVLRFGEYVSTIQNGFNLRFPYPIETVDIVDVQSVQAFNIGQGSSEALMLTKDKNIIDIEYVIQYQVSDAKKFILNTKEPLASLEHAAQTAVRELVGQNEMEYVQTQGRTQFAARAKERIQEILDRYQTGLLILSFEMQKAQAPRPVIPAYEEVNAAQQEKEAEINKAEAFANTIIPKAEGEANRLLEQAQQYKETLVARASGDAQRFTKLLTEYEKAPRVTRERLYIETMQDVFANSKKVIVDVEKGNSLLYLPLDQIVPKEMMKRESTTVEPNKINSSAPADTQDASSDRSRIRSRER